ncbi:MAG: phosphate acyltransferase [Gemmatimonadota bacterium]|uniref:phosphate acyltransferase n=1 Tax=Candidatus Palauibacter scopulicola TaxID=3056741 RepID=UPI00238BD57C|nr:phosphate acyltransferase [Candidatus Palauibacter scopulicola]MDE2663911.1 phosphate acyltransferase [Candidatus Palauibacter scopulicola]
MTPPTRAGFIDGLRARAAALERRIGFPEAHETRTALAIRRLREEGWVRPVEIRDGSGGLERAAQCLAAGELDGVVAGAVHPTADVIRAGLKVVGLADGVETVSAAFYMVFPGPGERVLTLTDAAVVPAPTPAQMAESASAACDAHRAIAGEEPVVAFLSYSTLGSAAGPAVEHVREALDIFRHRRPEIAADGELQADAALVPDVAALKAPGSPVAGRANLLVFPGLDAANIAYKLLERLAGARALGPVLQGLRRPLNDLSRGASASDIVDVACITALMSPGSEG